MKKQDLPKIIPVFPLSNFIIFPHTTVPLNIFEPRYVEMINDSLKSNKIIGLIQPKKNEEKIPFFNLGPDNDWKKILDKDQQLKLTDIFREDLIKLGYE